MSSQFYISENDLGKNRATISAAKLSELNPYVRVQANSEELGADNLGMLDQFTVCGVHVWAHQLMCFSV